MAARLPNPGGDAGNWGKILNEYLRVEHNADGTLKNVARRADLDAKANSAGLGTAATQDVEAFATADQGAKADAAIKHGDTIDGGGSMGITTLQIRRDTAAQWETANPILPEGEMGLELDTDKRKVGDGVHVWSDLRYDLSLDDLEPLTPGPGEVIVGSENSTIPLSLSGPAGAVLTGTGSLPYWGDPETGDRALDPLKSIQFVGDLHVGYTNQVVRHSIFSNDSVNLSDAVAHRIYVGDITNTPNVPTELAAAEVLLHGIDTKDRWDIIGGNHDINHTMNGEEFMAHFGYRERNWVRDFDFCRVIGLTPNGLGANDQWMTIPPSDLAWLSDRLGETESKCVIVYHAPLYNTVTYGPFPSTATRFHTFVDAAVRAVLNAHDNAYMWVAGHTHTPIGDPRILTTELVGDREIIHLSCPAIAYTGGSDTVVSPIMSPVVTFEGDQLYVRWRDHVAERWATVQGTSVWTVPAIPTPDKVIPTTWAVLSPDKTEDVDGTITPLVPVATTVVESPRGSVWSIAPGAGNTIKASFGSLFHEGEGSVAFWVNIDEDETGNDPIFYLGSGGPGSVSVIANNTNSTIAIHWRDELNTVGTGVATRSLKGGWHLIYFGWEGHTFTYSIDNEIGGTLTGPTTNPFAHISLGGGPASDAVATDMLVGPLSLFSRPLTSNELAHLWARTAPWRIKLLS